MTDREGLAVGWIELAAVVAEGAAHADVLEDWDAGKTYINMRQRIFSYIQVGVVSVVFARDTPDEGNNATERLMYQTS